MREQEAELVCGVLAQATAGEVIALGGGSVLSERVRDALGAHTTVLLDVDTATAWERVRGAEGDAVRPLARDAQEFAALHGERRALYESLADAVIAPLALGSGARVLGALRALEHGTARARACCGPARRPANTRSSSAAGCSAGTDGAAALWPLARSRSRAFCVSDENVIARYGARLGELAGSISIAPGEQHKTLARPNACGRSCSTPA